MEHSLTAGGELFQTLLPFSALCPKETRLYGTSESPLVWALVVMPLSPSALILILMYALNEGGALERG